MKLKVLLLGVVFLVVTGSIYAQIGLPIATPTTIATPTVAAPGNQVPTTTEVRTANCDACGYCAGAQKPGSWNKCSKCLYPKAVGAGATLIGLPTPDPNHVYTELGCVSTDPGEFAGQVSTVFFSLVGGIAFLYFLYGAGVIATSRADPERLNYGKRIIYGSIIGLLFTLFSVFIIRTISTSLGLPGLE